MKPLSGLLLALAAVSLGGLAAGGIKAAAAAEVATMPSRQKLLQQNVDLASPHITTNVIRVAFPPGVKTPLHTHEGPGPCYVLKGRLKVDDGRHTQVYLPGEVFWETGQEMTVENVGGSDAEMVIFEMVPRP